MFVKCIIFFLFCPLQTEKYERSNLIHNICIKHWVYFYKERDSTLVRECWMMGSPTHLTANERKDLCGGLQKWLQFSTHLCTCLPPGNVTLWLLPTRGAIYFFNSNQDWNVVKYNHASSEPSLKSNCFSSPTWNLVEHRASWTMTETRPTLLSPQPANHTKEPVGMAQGASARIAHPHVLSVLF